VFDGNYRDSPLLLVDAVDHAIVAPAGAVQPVKAKLERLSDRYGFWESEP
jgi:hypothetical protein